MYEELQQKRKPKTPKSIRADGIRGILGVISPSKLCMRQYALDKTEEEKRYFDEEWKYRLYKRRVRREEWRSIYRQYRREQHPERAQEWERKREEAAKEAIKAIRQLIGEI
jgi:hypothetical protein